MATPSRPTFISSVVYRDSRAALKWLQKAFGFEVSEVLTDQAGHIVHAEMTHGDGVVMIGSEYFDWTKSPLSVDGKNTQRLHVRIERGIDEHCTRAREAGAKILMPPADQFYGERCYGAVDLEGHFWTFTQTVREVSKDEMERTTGFRYSPLT